MECELKVQQKISDFSFEVKDGWRQCHYPEVDDIQNLVDNTIDSYRILKRAGKFKEA